MRRAFAKEVSTKGSTSQNHGLSVGIISIIIIIAVEIKKYNHHLPVPSVVLIHFNLRKYNCNPFVLKIFIK